MTKKILTIAALALMMAACSNEDTAQQPAPAAADANTMPFRAVISADNTPTRGLSEATDHKSITAKWEVGEQIALIHGKTIDVVEVLSVDVDAGVATLNGDITNYVANEAVYLVYVGIESSAMNKFKTRLAANFSSWQSITPSITAITEDMITEETFKYFITGQDALEPDALVQDGSLTTINNGFDYRLGTSTLTKTTVGTTDYVTLSDSPTLTSQFAIWKLNLTTDGTTALTATKLGVKDADNDEYITEITPSGAASEFYVVLPESTNFTYKFEATVGTRTYSVKHTGISLAAAKLYRSTLTMSSPAASKTLTAVTTSEVGWRIGSDGKAYEPSGDLPSGVTAVAMIAYVGSATGSATYNHGLAIALTDATIEGGTNSYCKWSDNTSSKAISASASTTMTAHKGFLNGIDATAAFTSTNPPLGADYTAAKKAKNYGVTAPTGTSGWFLPSSGQWLKFFEAAGVDVANWTSWRWAPAPGGGTQADNWTKINALLSAVGGAVEQDWYWSSSEYDKVNAVRVGFRSTGGVYLDETDKGINYCRVRSFLAF